MERSSGLHRPHATLTGLARGVNDLVSDARRDELVVHIPRVVGLTGPTELGLVVALRAAVVALPIASMERQRVLAAGALAIAAQLTHRAVHVGSVLADLESVLTEVPDAARWARTHVATISARYPTLDRVSTDMIVATALVGAARACIPDADGALIRMLTDAISDAEALTGSETTPAPQVRDDAPARPAGEFARIG